LRPIEEPLPLPAAQEIRLRVLATGVAVADILMREGVYPGVTFPLTPGYDVVGIVDALGVGCDASTPLGSRVAALTVTGGYARYACVAQRHCVTVPEGPDDARAVATVLNYLTAYQMLHRCVDLAAGDSVLVHGAAGGVGTALLQLAALRGLHALGTASRGKHDRVRALGGDPIDYRTEDFVARARAVGGVAAAFDPIGGAHVRRSFRALRPAGTVVTYGSSAVLRDGRLDIPRAALAFARAPRFAPLDLLAHAQGVVGYSIVAWRDARAAAYRADLTTLFGMLAEGRIDPIVDRQMPLGSAPEAHDLLGRAGAVGKIVLVPS